jgi:hypothetical protein
MISFKEYLTELQLNEISASHRAALSRSHKGNKLSSATKKKISRSMGGKSNFEGKHHTKQSKDRIRHKRGHDDRVKGARWVVNRSGKTARKHATPQGYRTGHRHWTNTRKTNKDE